jgi:hypothetical protein
MTRLLLFCSILYSQDVITVTTSEGSSILFGYLDNTAEHFPEYIIYDLESSYLSIQGYKDLDAIDIETNNPELLNSIRSIDEFESSDYFGYPFKDNGQIQQDSTYRYKF